MTQTMIDELRTEHLMVAGLVLLYITTRFVWWVGKLLKVEEGLFFPGFEFCQWVHKNAPKWRRRSADWITTIPQRISVIGFLSSLLWPVVVLLNLLLLAQVLEMYFPSETRVTIPYFGSYAVFPLLMGALFSIAQSMFGVVAGETGKKSVATLFILILILTIGIEMRLAYERAVYLEGGQGGADTTMTDRVISQGPLVAALVAFVVPVAHSVLGFLALPRFIFPGVGYVFRLGFGLALGVWAIFCSFFFAFHDATPISLPGAVGNLKKKAERLLDNAEETAGKVGQQEKNVSLLVEMQEPFPKLRDKVAALKAAGERARTEWKKDLDEINAELKESRSAETCEDLGQRLSALAAGISTKPSGIVTEADQLDGLLRDLPAAAQNWDARFVPLKTALPALKSEVSRREDLVRETEEERLNLIGILRPPKRKAEKTNNSEPAEEREFDEPLEAQLNELRKRAMCAPDPIDKQWALKEHTKCLEVLGAEVNNDLREAENKLNGLTHRISELESNSAEAAQNPPERPKNSELTAARNELAVTRREIVAAANQYTKLVRRLEKAIYKKEGMIEDAGLYSGQRRRFFLWEFFAWIGRTFSEIIEFIMGVNQEPPDKPGGTRSAAKA